MTQKKSYLILVVAFIMLLPIIFSGCCIIRKEKLQQIELYGNYAILSEKGIAYDGKIYDFVKILNKQIKMDGHIVNNSTGYLLSNGLVDDNYYFVYQYCFFGEYRNYVLGYFDCNEKSLNILKYFTNISFTQNMSFERKIGKHIIIKWGEGVKIYDLEQNEVVISYANKTTISSYNYKKYFCFSSNDKCYIYFDNGNSFEVDIPEGYTPFYNNEQSLLFKDILTRNVHISFNFVDNTFLDEKSTAEIYEEYKQKVTLANAPKSNIFHDKYKLENSDKHTLIVTNIESEEERQITHEYIYERSDAYKQIIEIYEKDPKNFYREISFRYENDELYICLRDPTDFFGISIMDQAPPLLFLYDIDSDSFYYIGTSYFHFPVIKIFKY